MRIFVNSYCNESSICNSENKTSRNYASIILLKTYITYHIVIKTLVIQATIRSLWQFTKYCYQITHSAHCILTCVNVLEFVIKCVRLSLCVVLSLSKIGGLENCNTRYIVTYLYISILLILQVYFLYFLTVN